MGDGELCVGGEPEQGDQDQPEEGGAARSGGEFGGGGDGRAGAARARKRWAVARAPSRVTESGMASRAALRLGDEGRRAVELDGHAEGHQHGGGDHGGERAVGQGVGSGQPEAEGGQACHQEQRHDGGEERLRPGTEVARGGGRRTGLGRHGGSRWTGVP
ncbi:hypothetical protein GCM10020229_31830 [Kitasatospora albolonga]